MAFHHIELDAFTEFESGGQMDFTQNLGKDLPDHIVIGF